MTGTYVLVQTTGTLSITTTPVSGSIYVDGVYKGTGSWSGLVNTGSHTVSFGTVSGYTTPSQQTVTVNAGQTTTVTGTYVSTQLRILDSSISPNVASPGDTLSFVYSINNPSTSNVNNVRLGARIRTYSPQGVWIDDWNNDKIEIIYPGTRNYVRSFKVPSTASLGLYDAQWVIVNNADETWYDSRIYSPILTIQSSTGTLSITTTPVSGSIYVDGIYKGTGSWSGSVSIGSHTVSFGTVSGYTTPSQQTVTVNKGLTTTITGTYVSTQLRILDSSVYPNVASPGDMLDFVYSINNPGTTNVNNVRLGARIRTYSPQGVWIDDWDNDKVEIIYPGTRNYVRSFKVPSTASLGLYDAQWVIVNNLDETWYDNRTYSPILTIQSNTGTLSITTTPVSGSISVDGIYKGTGSWSGSVSIGSHIVSFGAVSGYTTPSQQTVTINKGLTTTVTGTYVSNPVLRILDSSVYPNVASPGDTLDFVYSINNPSTTNVNNVRLGARIRTNSPQGVWIDDRPNDKVEIIYPGTRNYNRSYKVNSTASLGLYDAQWVILDNADESKWFDNRTYSPILTIQSNQVTEKSLLKVVGSIDVYWLQNKKLYWVTEAAMTPMTGIPGWGWDKVKVYPSSVFNPGIL